MKEKKDSAWLLNKAYFFLKFRLRTEKELKDYLLKKGQANNFSVEDVQKVINKLKKQGLINDQKFIESFVSQRLSFKPKSQSFLEKELLRLGIEEKIIKDYFLKNPINDKETAFKALTNVWHRFKKKPKKERFKKAISFLLRQGYSYDLAKSVFEKLNLNND